MIHEVTTGFLFGHADARKLSEGVRSNWVWCLTDYLCRIESEEEAFPLLEKLTFSLGAGDDTTNPAEDHLRELDDDESREFAKFLCTKEEVAKREALVAAAEAEEDEEYFLKAEKEVPEGEPFSEKELIDKVQPFQAAAAAAAAAAAEAASEHSRQRRQLPPESETERGVAPNAAVVPETDGPDALDVDATHPSNQIAAGECAEGKQEINGKKNSQPAGTAAVAVDGPHELQTDLTAPQLNLYPGKQQDAPVFSSEKHLDNHHGSGNPSQGPSPASAAGADIIPPQRGVGWMAGAWGPQPARSLPETAASLPLAINMAAIPSSGQNTPSGMFKSKDAATPAGDGGVPATAAGVMQSSIVPETQPEQLQYLRETEGMDSSVRPAAPGALLNMPLDVAVPETDAGAIESQPIGSQQLKDAFIITGMIADELLSASQQEEELGSGLNLLGKGGGGGGGLAVPAPRRSTRFAPTARDSEVKESTDEGQQKPLPPQQQQQKVPPKLNTKKADLRRAHVGKVMVKNRPDLGLGEKLILVKDTPPVVPTRKQPVRGQKQQQHTPADEGKFRTTRRHVLLSGLHDTEDCYEMDGTDRTALADGDAAAVPATTVSKAPAAAAGGHSRASPSRLAGVLAAITDHEEKRAGVSDRRIRNLAKESLEPPPGSATEAAAAALKSMVSKKAVLSPTAAAADDGDHPSDPFHFPSDAAPAKQSPGALRAPSARKSSRPPSTAATDVAPRQPYQPGPIKQNIDGLMITRLPHPIIQTASEYSSVEISVTAGLAELQTTTQAVGRARRNFPKKRKHEVEHKVEALTDHARPSPKRQRRDIKNTGDGNEDGGRHPHSGRRQAAIKTPRPGPADSEDQTIKERWLSTGTKRKQNVDKVTPPASSPRRKKAAKEVEAEKKLQQTPKSSGVRGSGSKAEKKLQQTPKSSSVRGSGSKARLSPPAAGVTYGCSKCRFSKNGCSTCRAKAAKTSNPMRAPAPAPAPVAKRRLSSLPPPPPPPSPAAKKPKDTVSRLPIPAHRVAIAATTTGSGPLQGMSFLVSVGSSEGTEAKGTIEEIITSLGGRILSDIPPPPPAGTAAAACNSTLNRRLSVELRSPSAFPQVDAVVADRNARRAKCIYAAIKGIPVIAPGWLKVCKKSKKRAPWTGKYQLLAETDPAPAPVFAGLRVHLKVSGKKSVAQGIAQLMQHAGAQMTTAPKESSKDYEPSCDLVIIGTSVLKN